MPDIPEVVQTAIKRFKLCRDAEKALRDECLDDLKFRSGEQWPSEVKKQRELDKRPCLTINRLPQFLRQVTNEQRQNRPSIHVNPVDDDGDPQTAEVIQGLIRHIEYDSSADVAYDTAFEGAATHGFGFWRVITEYEDDNSFNQVIRIKRIRNPFLVYFDPTAQLPDYSDAEFAFILETLTEDEYKDQYPNSEAAALDDWNSVGDTDPDWISKTEGIRVAECFYRERKEDTLWSLPDGTTEIESNIPEKALADLKEQNAKSRKTESSTIKWCKLNAIEVLEEQEWPGKWIPIVPVLGDELDVDGKRVLEGVVRHAKEPMRQYNYMASAQTEAIALAPKAPWLVAEGQLEGYTRLWDNANVKSYAYLPYKPKALGGEILPPPTRSVVEPAVQAITQARGEAAEDLKSTTGIYDASLGAKSNEQTGRAILARQQQGQIANFHYIDNLSRAIRHCGRIILDLIPKIYDTPRVLRIIGDDGEQKTVKVNQASPDQQKTYDLTAGKYDVTISSGPSYQTRRQEATASMLEFIKAFPQAAPIIGDLVAAMMDWHGAKKIAERLKKALPPQFQDDGTDPEARASKLQSQLQAMMQQHDMLTQQLNEAKDVIQHKVIEAQQKMDIEKLKIQAEVTIAEIQTKAQEAQLRMKMESDIWRDLHGQAHDVGMEAMQQAHKTDMASMQQGHEMSMADQAAQQAQAQQSQQA